MRSNALPYSKISTEEKRLIRQPSAATFSHRRRHICTPACSCLLLLVAKHAFLPAALPSTIQLLFPRGRPSVARFCTPVFPPTSRLHIDFRFFPVGVGAPDDPHAPSPTNLPSTISTPAPHPPKKVVISINSCYNETTDLLRTADRNSLSHDTVAEVEKQKIRRRKN